MKYLKNLHNFMNVLVFFPRGPFHFCSAVNFYFTNWKAKVSLTLDPSSFLGYCKLWLLRAPGLLFIKSIFLSRAMHALKNVCQKWTLIR